MAEDNHDIQSVDGIERCTQAVQGLAAAYRDLAGAIGAATDAIKGLDGITYGSVEFARAGDMTHCTVKPLAVESGDSRVATTLDGIRIIIGSRGPSTVVEPKGSDS